MIRASHLSMSYGTDANSRALDDVSFEVGRGEIVALLGPNGAGKTTLMRILSGFLAPTSGDAALAGFSIHDQSLAVRRQVGYLPEGVPLYPDMRVDEYLVHRARLRGLAGAQRARQIDRALVECGLGERRRQIIGTLSRGFRQRVGLADAILARPPILILDEPTVGLDPNQIREVRALIRALAREATVLLSTHILSEVEALDARVIILHRGRVAAGAGTGVGARAGGGGARLGEPARVVVELRAAERARALGLLRALPVVAAVDELADGRLAVSAAPGGGVGAPGDLGEEIFRAMATAGLTLRELRREASSLEEIFSRITTGRADAPADDRDA
ncbi:MAG TPA: ATP-binding cassette domain-containing protein [Polyangia bacterium]|nr:ATP-binding cassette domain-containing protein [Polyangia bacterium]